MAKFNTGQSFADGDTVTGAKLNNITGLLDIYSGVIADQTAITATVSTADLLLIADTDAGSSGAANKVTVQKLFSDSLTNGTFASFNLTGTITSNRTVATSATITTGTIPTLVSSNATIGTTTGTAGVFTSGTITTGLIPTLTVGTTTGTAGIFTSGTVATLNSTTGTIATLRSTSGSATTLSVGTSLGIGLGATSPTEMIETAENKNITIGKFAYFGGLYSSQGALFGYNAKADTTSNVVEQVVVSNNSATVGYGFIRAGISSAGGAISFHATSGTVTAGDVITNSNERMRIDSNGDVGIGTASPVNKLEIVGSFGRGAPVTKTANFTLADTENWLIVNQGSTCTVTLPAASSWTGREFSIKTIQAFAVVSISSNVIPRIGGAAGTAILPATDGAWATLVSNGTDWEIMCGS